jgi:ComF family protein
MEFKRFLTSLASPMLLCPGCHQPSNEGLLCATCSSYLHALEFACPLCGEPDCDNQLCGQCLQKKPIWDELHIRWHFDGLTRHLIHQFKYHNDLSAGRALSILWTEQPLATPKPDAIISVPMHNKKHLNKGFNHADVISKHLANRLNIPIWKGITRSQETPPLEGLSKSERTLAVKNAFDTTKKPPNSVAIVDDVFTSGATATEITRTLKKAGCQNVLVWALARTPLR